METLLQSTSLVKRAYWLVRLRWIAIALLAAATFVASKVLNVSLPVFALYLVAGLLVLYNFLLFDLLNYFTWGGKSASHITISRIITFQISADLFILTTILHYSGGIENPFFVYFVFHMIIASILLSTRQSYLQATLAAFLFGLLILLEYLGIISHYNLVGFVANSLYRHGLFVLGTFLILSTTLYLVVYMTTSISEQLRKQQADYERANILLKEKDHLKNEYVLRLTHDIRGHLAAIQSCLDIVIERTVGPLNEKQADLVQRACGRTAKCMAFVTALLKLTRMKLSGQLEIEYFSLKNTIFNAFASAENKAASKFIDLKYDIEPSVDEIYGESVLIEEAITNLLFNAVRYTPEKGSIKLTAKDQDDSVLIQVSDTGIGIPEGEISKIFDEFYRADNARKVERDGTGLGLSIAKQVVERHGGRIWAQNNQTAGSTFSFTLPKVPPKSDDNTGKET
jgi:signal transduction histidine kinase